MAINLLKGGIMMLSMVSVSAFSATVQRDPAPLALQMYTLRSAGTLDQQFALASNSGFQAVELVNDHGVSAKEMTALLAKYHLRAIADHVQLEALEKEPDRIVEFNKAVGNTTLVIPFIKPEIRPDSATAWQEMAQRLDRLGAQLRSQGMTLAYHNHNFEMKKYDGKTALAILMENSSPENLKLELDVAWASRGGQDPAQILNSYKGRVFAIHAKDNASIGIRDDEMNFAPAGEGILDWSTLLPAAQSAGTRWYIVEHDKPRDPAAIITAAKAYLEKVLVH